MKQSGNSDALPSEQAEFKPLYASREKIHPKAVQGTFRRLKSAMLWGLLLLYHFTPLIPWARSGEKPNQAILFDISGERIYLFDLEIWPQDIYILTAIMIVAAIGLFLSATLVGRAWCGFACFQTVWTDLFMKVENWVEGDRNARIRLDNAPMGLKKLFKRTLKHTLWLSISFFFALSFLWYFHDPLEVTKSVLSADISGWTLAIFATLVGMTYVMAGFAREQVCFYMCPYGRFQGVMFDQHSKVVAYQTWRGEPRNKFAKNKDQTNNGHCVDCTLCVQVCPTGIDIRDGQQMECIGCALCVDACNTVMDKLSLPRNLITYDSKYNIDRAQQGKAALSPWLRPRVLIYGLLLLATLSVSVIAFNMRDETTVSVLRDRAPFYVVLSDGKIQNAYTVRIINKSTQDKQYELSISGLSFPDLKIVGRSGTHIDVKAGEVATLRLIVKARLIEGQAGRVPVYLNLADDKNKDLILIESVFAGPQT